MYQFSVVLKMSKIMFFSSSGTPDIPLMFLIEIVAGVLIFVVSISYIASGFLPHQFGKHNPFTNAS